MFKQAAIQPEEVNSCPVLKFTYFFILVSSVGSDSEPPVIHNCPESQTVYVEANFDYALATWDIPIATDNHDPTVMVTLEEGLSPGSQFTIRPSNVHEIVYGAADEAGNVAVECSFSVIVQRKTSTF